MKILNSYAKNEGIHLSNKIDNELNDNLNTQLKVNRKS
jgi:hypothetical protein